MKNIDLNKADSDLSKAKTALYDAWDVLEGQKSFWAPLGDEWHTIHKAQCLLIARMQNITNIQKARGE